MNTVLVRASARCLLVRFGDQWFRYDTWERLLRDLSITDRLRIEAVAR